MIAVEWTRADAQRTAEEMAAEARLGAFEPVLLRFGNNAVFALGEAYVLRLMRPTVDRADVQQEIDLVQEFTRLDVPTARLAELAAEQPLEAHGCLATVWEHLDEPCRNQIYPEFSRLVRTFHERTVGLRLPLDRWRPLASAERRLAQLRRHYPPDDVALLEHWREWTAAGLDPALPGVRGGLRLRRSSLGRLRDVSATMGATRYHVAHATWTGSRHGRTRDRSTPAELAGR